MRSTSAKEFAMRVYSDGVEATSVYTPGGNRQRVPIAPIAEAGGVRAGILLSAVDLQEFCN